MNKSTVWTIVIVAAVVIIGGFWWMSMSAPNSGTAMNPTSTNTGNPTSTPGNNLQSLTLAGGELALSFDPSRFSLATTQDQVLVKSYIPPCDEGFSYCIYAASGTYAGTNFESAGIAIKKRTDLATERLCLNTPPSGYSAGTRPIASSTSDLYSASTFGNVGDAAAGHIAAGSEYRAFVRQSGTCYQFTTRVGQSQFANYPSGSIIQFTNADQAAMMGSLKSVLSGLHFAAGGTAVLFPGQ